MYILLVFMVMLLTTLVLKMVLTDADWEKETADWELQRLEKSTAF